MDQHVIQAVKLHYRKSLLYKIVADEDKDITATLKSLDLKSVVYSLNTAWGSVSQNLIRKSWKKLWPANADFDEEDFFPLARLKANIGTTLSSEPSKEERIKEMTIMCNTLSKNESFSEAETENCSIENMGETEDIFFSDDEIVDLTRAEEIRIDDDSNDEPEVSVSAVSHQETSRCLGVIIQWAFRDAFAPPTILDYFQTV